MTPAAGDVKYLGDQYVRTRRCEGQETVRVEEIYSGPMEISADWESTIIANADTGRPLIEFYLEGRRSPILVHIEVANLDVVWRKADRSIEVVAVAYWQPQMGI